MSEAFLCELIPHHVVLIHQLAHNMALTHGPMFSMTLGPNQGSPASLAVVLFGSGLLHGFLVSWGS